MTAKGADQAAPSPSPPAAAAGRSLARMHALVTGGSRGIGAAVARLLLTHGARVTILGRNPVVLERTLAELKPLGDVQTTTGDVSSPKAVATAFDHARNLFGDINILINNAGQAGSAPFAGTDLNLWRRMLDVNLKGTFLCMQAVMPGMVDAGWGRIVNVASTAGLVGYRYVSAYCAAKHAVVGLTRAVALEVATKGITVNAVCPGYTDTDLIKDAVATIVAKTGRTPAQAAAELTARNPQHRLVRAEEVANAVAWLCLPGSEAITGQAIAVAGGEVM